MKKLINLKVNGDIYEIWVEPWRSLLDVIRQHIGLTGAKEACGTGECGSCTLLVDGKPVNSCLVLAVEAQGKEILTIEGLAEGQKMHFLQEAFVRYGAIQCGFCTGGMILSAKALLDKNSRPTEEEVKRAISGNLCRCTGYVKIIQAVLGASESLENGGGR